MAAPAIALRFRDTTPGIDTIAEHRELIARDGRVGWGWWKKTFEPAETKKINALLDDDREIGIILIDRTAERAYLCTCVGFAEPNAAEAKIVPPYYRDHLDETAGVFILRTIEDLDYDEALADAIREQTFLWIGDDAFGECVTAVADLERLGLTNDIAAIIVTGDFMTHGDWARAPRRAALAEFETLRKRLELQKNQIIAVPGNHDVVRYSDPATINVRENAVEKQANYEHETMFRTRGGR